MALVTNLKAAAKSPLLRTTVPRIAVAGSRTLTRPARPDGGRASNAEYTVTVFGAYGFIGSYVCSCLGEVGATLVIPFRGDELEIRHIKVMADNGQVAQMPFNLRDKDSIRAAIEGSDAVVNCIGKHYRTKHFLPGWGGYTFEDAHVTGARDIAAISREMGVKQFIQLSSVLADPYSSSTWARSKYFGELAVKDEFPSATIVRPSIVFGYEDRFLNWYAGAAKFLPRVPIFEGGQAQIQPVYVEDVARAIFKILTASDANYEGKTFELFGDERYTYKEIVEFVFETIHRKPKLIDLSAEAGRTLGKVLEFMNDPKLTVDGVERMLLDQTPLNDDVLTLKNLNITPTSLEMQSFDYLYAYRQGGHFVNTTSFYDEIKH